MNTLNDDAVKPCATCGQPFCRCGLPAASADVKLFVDDDAEDSAAIRWRKEAALPFETRYLPKPTLGRRAMSSKSQYDVGLRQADDDHAISFFRALPVSATASSESEDGAMGSEFPVPGGDVAVTMVEQRRRQRRRRPCRDGAGPRHRHAKSDSQVTA